MNKDEFIDTIVNAVKNGDYKTNHVHCFGINCGECPLFNDGEDDNGHLTCADATVDLLIDRIIELEEAPKSETNLEHYTSKLPSIGIEPSSGIEYDKVPFWFYADTLTIELEDGWKESINWSDPIKWLLSPYEKQKYKLSKFEHDLLNSCYDKTYGIKESWILKHMHDKGYFKGIPTDAQIRDILDNCEVVDDNFITYERITNGFIFKTLIDDENEAVKVVKKVVEQMIYEHDEIEHGVRWVTISLKVIPQEERYKVGTNIEWIYRVRDSY